MGILIDASVLIDHERRGTDVSRHVKGREQEEVFLSVITASELLHGVWRAADHRVRVRRSAFVEGILEKFIILPIDAATARLHAQLWAELESKGAMIGPHDSWLAAACLSHGHILATANVREFARVPGLRIETWSAQ